MAGVAQGTPVTSNAVTVQNSAPSLTSVMITPPTPFAGDTLTADPLGVSA